MIPRMEQQMANANRKICTSVPKAGIIGAEQQEVDLLREKLTGARFFESAGMPFWEGELGGVPVAVARCGVGKVNAAMCVQILADRCGVSAVLNTGSAGGTDSSLGVLDMVVSSDAVFHDVDVRTFGYAQGQVPGTPSPFFVADGAMRRAALQVFAGLDAEFYAALEQEAASVLASGCPQETPPADPHLPLRRLPRMKEGRVASGDLFVSDEGVRAGIVSAFSPACVEMEGAAVAQAACANGLPFLILRNISDLAGNGSGLSYTDFSWWASRISAAVVLRMLGVAESWLPR